MGPPNAPCPESKGVIGKNHLRLGNLGGGQPLSSSIHVGDNLSIRIQTRVRSTRWPD